MNIKNIFIKEKYESEGYVVISNINEAEKYAQKAIFNGFGNFILDKPYLLSIFIAAIKFYQNNISLINCNASEDRLINDLYDANINDNLCIYYNLRNCNNQKIIDNINKKSGILCL